MKQDETEQVVVSAGEPVAWEIHVEGHALRGERWWHTKDRDIAEASADSGYRVTALHASAPVVLPEAPSDDLIEAMAKAALEEGGDYTWERSSAAGRDLYLEEARAQYAALRAWVAGGGETR